MAMNMPPDPSAMLGGGATPPGGMGPAPSSAIPSEVLAALAKKDSKKGGKANKKSRKVSRKR